MGDEKYLITLDIANRKYPIKVSQSEEEAFRVAAQTLNNKINQYRIKFGANPQIIPQDLMAMTAIQALVESFFIARDNDTKPQDDKIQRMIHELDDYLKRNL